LSQRMARVRPRGREDLAAVELEGELVLLDEGTGALHHLNPTASLIFALCDGTATIHDIVADLATASGRRDVEIDGDVRRVLRQMRKSNLLVPHRP
jgi:Coenzyme PQQ synthesis protein D (PqqD)